MHYPIAPNFPQKDEDTAYLNEIRSLPVRPIFIMGLHRSGTTFLYDSISRCFPVANLTLYDLFYYHRLLKNHQTGQAEHDKQHLNRVFRSLGITDRKLDAVWVDDAMVEEYGWMLRNESYHMALHASNKDFFAEICRKLLCTNPEARSVLLKNPWDTGNAKQILEWFPEARFIYITRNPIHILNSQLNALLTLLSGEQPFQTMLIDHFKVPGNQRWIMPLVYAGWKLVRGLKALTGDTLVTWLVRPFAVLSLQSQLKSYYQDLKTLPPQHVYQLTYNDFNTDPVSKLKELQVFLDLPFTEAPEYIRPKPRSGHLNERLRKYEPRLMKKLKKILGHSADVENRNLEKS